MDFCRCTVMMDHKSGLGGIFSNAIVNKMTNVEVCGQRGREARKE